MVNGRRAATFNRIEALDLECGHGADTVVAGAGNDNLAVNGGANRVGAGAGNDHVRYVAGWTNTLDGGAGTDTLEVGVYYDIAFRFDALGGTDSYGSSITRFERFDFVGGHRHDVARLGAESDRFNGGLGNDQASLGGGTDTARGSDGSDRLYGEAGADALSGDAGGDRLYGGSDSDRLYGGHGSDLLVGARGATGSLAGQVRACFALPQREPRPT